MQEFTTTETVRVSASDVHGYNYKKVPKNLKKGNGNDQTEKGDETVEPA